MAKSFLTKFLSNHLGLVGKIAFDKIKAEFVVPTRFLGSFLSCQVRQNSSGDEYLVFRTKGGDSIVWVAIEGKSVEDLLRFIKYNYSEYPEV